MSDLIDVSELMTDPDFAQTLTRRQTAGARNEYGEWTSAAPVDSDVVGCWQKVTEREIKQFNFGEIKEEIRKFLSVTNLNKSADDKLSDRLVWPKTGGIYKVIKTADNSDNGFYRSFAVFEGVE